MKEGKKKKKDQVISLQESTAKPKKLIRVSKKLYIDFIQ